ncbi:MAG: bifunctional phosphopantothenoylcysteine decarboxylase/phosphopantothenate--cysteine ligase CoaBC [Bacteroidales bacterium]|nr:bifunctional phosphopantothenoylcysteine decarboxylase/phosphopantothenate--cysteine ligase CoaBC [Bacteroidales bacterium]
MRLKGKHIILGITGSIAAYKAAMLARLLIKEGAQVKIVVTPLAKEFITPVTLATLSKNTVLCDFFHHDDGAWNSHIELGIWADLMLIAPATANTIAKMAHGIADNLLLTTYLSVRCPVMVAPAMDTDMYMHIATQTNIKQLQQRGVYFIEPPSGELASGLTGKGRMEEPEKIVEHVVSFFALTQRFSNKNVLITAGPTYEYIDPVRFIGNASSGKMGYAIAHAFAQAGAKVTIVSGPVNEQIQHPNINIISVISADEMLNEAIQNFKKADIAILAAAVADFKPLKKENIKIKQKDKNLIIELTPTPDIAATLGKMKKKKQIIIGFALETNEPQKNAYEKLTKKNLDAIILNTISNKLNPIANDVNQITILNKQNKSIKYPLKTKKELALDIVRYTETLLNE